MNSFRIKIISASLSSIEQKNDEIISISDRIWVFSSESACDYNILVVFLSDVSAADVRYNVSKLDFNDFLKKPSIIVGIAAVEGFVDSISNYSWLPKIERVTKTNKHGESLTPSASSRWNKLLNEYKWNWKCIFSQLPTSPYSSLANNISGQSVALQADIEEGKVLLLPNPKIDTKDSKKLSAFIRQIIDLSKEEVEDLTHKERNEPKWLEKCVDPLELKLSRDIKDLQKRHQVMVTAHKLLYETGKNLTSAVNLVLAEIGFPAEMRENKMEHDIEICEGKVCLVIEVTSSEENWINIEKTRQLSDWCKRFEKEHSNKPKGILIANPYCNLPPKERDEPFTQGALKQAENENFCLMTTDQLYKIFCHFINGTMSKNEIYKLFLGTTGLLKL